MTAAGQHRELMAAAIERDGAAQRALLAGDAPAAREAFAQAAELYRRSWEAASSTSYGRLIGMLKAAVLAGAGEEEARYVRSALGANGPESPAAAYAQAIAALLVGDDEACRRFCETMRGGSEAFARTAAAIGSIASGDADGYAAALGQVVDDFERRSEHLTGVAIADTALMLQRLAARRRMAVDLSSPVLPAV